MKTVFVVEDDPFILDIYTTKLRESGFSVESSSNGQDCIKKVQEVKPDLVLLDIVLPGLDGWEIIREIKKQGEFKDLPIVILSNLSQKQEVEKGLDLGAVKYLIKSNYTPGEVVDEIKDILRRKMKPSNQ